MSCGQTYWADKEAEEELVVKFKVGDKVRCTMTGGSASELKFGRFYDVTKAFSDCGNEYLHLTDVNGSWLASRFELVEEKCDQVNPATIGIPTDSAERKKVPMCTGLLDYFPDALAEVAKVSFMGNEKHNPGQPLHHARGKSMDHADCIVRHLARRGGFDGGVRESAAMAWRALALLQEELEAAGAPKARGAK